MSIATWGVSAALGRMNPSSGGLVGIVSDVRHIGFHAGPAVAASTAWAMVIVGLGMMGGSLRRRGVRVVVA